jgi:ceramide glucosyltransferase
VIGGALLAMAGIALALAVVQVLSLRRHVRAPAPAPRNFPYVSILKPLCGVDDDLLRNLRSFTRLDYPHYEIVLGVKDGNDAAYPVALEAARRWAGLVRVVLQRGSPGLNPKVNQLITLAAAARGEVLVVSDSNIRVGRDYLRTIAAAFDDERVALVSHPVAGSGEKSAGAFLDNSTLCGAIAAGIVSARRIARQDLVVGKSMAFRRKDLEAMGGFVRLKDVLAEDFLSGRIVTQELGRKVALCGTPVFNVGRTQCVKAFFSRYLRWSVMQRKAVGNSAYSAQVMLHPVALGLAAFAAMPGRWTALGFAGIWIARSGLHESAARALRGRGYGLRAFGAPAGDLVVATAWFCGLFKNGIEWRGNRLTVDEGTVLRQRGEPRHRPVDPATLHA